MFIYLNIYSVNAKDLKSTNNLHKSSPLIKKNVVKYPLIDKASASYVYSIFDKYFDPQHLFRFGLSKKFNTIGTLITRLDYAYRFNKKGLQYELDNYSKIKKGLNSYLNFGFSNSGLFPKFRYGIELWKSVPLKFIVSLGLRHLQFSSNDVNILTGSIDKYYKNYYYSLRGFFSRKPSSLISKSFNLNIRKYKGKNNYLGLTLGFGVSPDERERITGELETYFLKSYKVATYFQKLLTSKIRLKGKIGYIRQELEFKQGHFINNYQFSIGIQSKF